MRTSHPRTDMMAKWLRFGILSFSVSVAFLALPCGAQTPFLSSFSPTNPAQPAAPIVFSIADTNALAVTASSVTVLLDSVAVKPAVVKTSGVTTASYTNAVPWASNSTHSVRITFAWTGGGQATTNLSFQTVPWQTLSTSLMYPLGSGSSNGILCNVYQTDTGPANSLQNAELILQGQLGPNVADLSGSVSNNTFIPPWPYVDFYNPYNGSASDVDFGYDNYFPGIPGITGSSSNFVNEFLAHVQFPTPGFYQMGVAGEDGFKVSVATGYNTNAMVLGAADGLRSSADSFFTFYVPQGGIWPLRLLYYEGGKGGDVEWYSIAPDGTYLLLNDPFPANKLTPLTAYLSVTGSITIPALLTIGLTNGTVTVGWNTSGTLQSTTNVLGPWTSLSNAPNPYVTPLSGPRGFFRVVN